MKTRVAVVLLAIVAASPVAGGEMFINHFDGTDPWTGIEVQLNDIYVNTGGHEWLCSVIYCELEEGELYQNPAYNPNEFTRWICAPGVNNYDTWLVPQVFRFADGDALASLFSGDPDNAAASITFIANLVDGRVPSWEGIAGRFAFTPNATGVWAFKVDEKGSEAVIHTGVITDGQMIWPEPIPGDLNADGYVDTADLDIVRANWAGDGIILGGLDYGDPSKDGEVGGDDLDIVRANWGQTAGAAAVPEPGWLIVALGGFAWGCCGRCRCEL